MGWLGLYCTGRSGNSEHEQEKKGKESEAGGPLVCVNDLPVMKQEEEDSEINNQRPSIGEWIFPWSRDETSLK